MDLRPRAPSRQALSSSDGSRVVLSVDALSHAQGGQAGARIFGVARVVEVSGRSAHRRAGGTERALGSFMLRQPTSALLLTGLLVTGALVTTPLLGGCAGEADPGGAESDIQAAP